MLFSFSLDLPCRTANRCFINGADLYADIGEYDEAIQHYENVAKSDVTKYKAPDYLFRACLCALAKGVCPQPMVLLAASHSCIGPGRGQQHNKSPLSHNHGPYTTPIRLFESAPGGHK